MKILKKLKALTALLVTMLLTLSTIRITTAQTSDEIQTFFSSDYAGISIQVNATREADPGENIAINLWLNCTADGVHVYYLNISIYGYRHFKYGLEKITLNFTCVLENIPLVYNHTSEYNYTVPIPSDVWDVTYAELCLKYAIKGLPLEYNPFFPITTVRNVLWEELETLETQLKRLNQSYQQLNNTYWQLNSTYEQLNQTFWELQQNYTSLNQTYWNLKGSMGELETTRNIMTVLAITTVFFVATTVYLVVRKPKQYW